MGFLSADTKKALEGKFLKWIDGQERILKLVGIEHKTATYNGEEREVDEITVVDQESGQEKVFRASRSFLRELSKLDDMLSSGSIIRVCPKVEKKEWSDGSVHDNTLFSITLVQ
jgi:hypothetical protein